jgi:predicted glycoside hydrolase/deacetylase ChbG (UPF0249 family)
MKLLTKATLAAVTFSLFAVPLAKADGATLAERLGYKATDKLLIINGDDTGMCHAANVATIDSLERGLMTSATIMVPCPWFTEIARYAKANPEKDFGIHLCHTSEWQVYRWGPVASRDKVPGLVDSQGYLWPSVPEVYIHGKPEQALIEGRAQIQKALDAGVDVSHLDSHMGTLQLEPRYLQVYLQLAVEFDVPLRMPSQATAAAFGFPDLRSRFADKGIVFPDYFVYEELKNEKKGVKQFWLNIVRNLKPGVTELYIHAAKPTEELRHITNSWKTRSEEYETFTNDADMKKLIKDMGIIRIGFKELRDLQRAKKK